MAADLLPMLLRYILFGIGLLLTRQGVVDEEAWTTITGAVVQAAPLIWAAIRKIRDRQDRNVVAAIEAQTAAVREVATAAAGALVAEPTAATAQAAAAIPGLGRLLDDATARLLGTR